MKLQILLYAIWTLAVTATVPPSFEACNSRRQHIATIKTGVKHPVHFCQYYLSAKRSRSPIAKLGPHALVKACACVLKHANVAQPRKTRPRPVSGPPSSPKCQTRFTPAIRREFVHPSLFCQYYDVMPRTKSPIVGMSAKHVAAGCKCLLRPVASTRPVKETTSHKSPRTKQSITSLSTSLSSSLSSTDLATSLSRTSTDNIISPDLSSIFNFNTSSFLEPLSLTVPIIASILQLTVPIPSIISSSVLQSTAVVSNPAPASISASAITTDTTPTAAPTAIAASSTTIEFTPTATPIAGYSTTVTEVIPTPTSTVPTCASAAPMSVLITTVNMAQGAAASASYSVMYTGYGTIATGVNTLVQDEYDATSAVTAVASSCAQLAVSVQDDTQQTQFEIVYVETPDVTNWVCLVYTEMSGVHDAAVFAFPYSAVQCVFGYSERQYQDQFGLIHGWAS